MIYLYKRKERYVLRNKPDTNEDYLLVGIYSFDSIPKEYIRPLQYLGVSDECYKSGIKKCLEEYPNSSVPSLKYVYKKDVTKVFNRYIEVLELFKSLELISTIPVLKYRRFIIYDCDIENYLGDILGEDLLGLCNYYMESLTEEKRNLLIKFSELDGKESRLSFLNGIDIDSDLYTFLPPWYKVSYKIFGDSCRIIRNDNVVKSEYDGDGRIDGYLNMSAIRDDVLLSFRVGQELSAIEIKEILRGVYEKHGLRKSAKVNDLEEYFDIVRNNRLGLYRIEKKKE